MAVMPTLGDPPAFTSSLPAQQAAFRLVRRWHLRSSLDASSAISDWA